MKFIKLITTITLSIAILFMPVLPVFASEDNLNKIAPNQQISLPISQSNLASTKKVKVKKITLPKEPVTIVSGSTRQLFPIISPSNADNQNVIWKSSKPSVATVDSNGIASGWSAGTTIITVITVDGKKTAKCTINVNITPTVKVTGISLNQNNITVGVGENKSLIATVSPSNATCKDVAWYSATPSIATVDKNGKIIGVAPGITAINVLTLDSNKSANCWVKVPNPNSITFIDKNLEKAIRESLKKPSEDLFKSDLQKITTLDVNSKSISNISGIENLTNLTSLNLYYNNITNVDVLKDLTKLTYLNLCRNPINDISPLSGLVNLRSLDLGITKVANIDALTGLTNLTKLSFLRDVGVIINDISPLKNLTKLTELDISGIQVSDITPLRDLTNLSILDLSQNQIIDITPLGNLVNLTDLNLCNNDKIRDISALRYLTKLTGFALFRSEVSDISVLSGLTNLTGLVLENNRITDISPLRGLTKLTFLELNNMTLPGEILNRNEISDISPLGGLIKLTFLDLTDNKISNINPLKKLINLTVLGLEGNPISDTDMESLRNALPNCDI